MGKHMQETAVLHHSTNPSPFSSLFLANRTISGATFFHGSDPQHLVEKIIRERIYDSIYWKEDCFGLTGKPLGSGGWRDCSGRSLTHCVCICCFFIAATLMDRAVELTCIGGEFGSHEPTPFLCLLLKMLQLQPEKEIVVDLIKQEDFK